ncbi:methyl-accepting chemotaxis protein [Pokkaliibacter plantistimulans]|uniref:methyl-accepting chemotaxis protein n=1 Tax=Pokkaliibacter plantistimulans TaxID=1635171 RepID=UPI0026A17E5A|nr:methyl-accepting chemotaxis protein [Pokkaliibacter plantistimulans]
MERLEHLTTRSKLLLSFGVVFLLLLAVSWSSAHSLQQLQSAQQRLYDTYVAQLLSLKNIRINLNSNRADILQLLMNNDTSNDEKIQQRMYQRGQDDESAMQQLITTNVTRPQMLAVLNQMVEVRHQYQAVRERQLLAIRSGDSKALEQAQTLAVGEQVQRVEQLRALAEQASQLIEQNVALLQQQSSDTLQQQESLLLGVTLLAALLIVALVIWLNRQLALPLVLLTQWAQRIAQGELPQNMEVSERRDEVGQLHRAFSQMGGYLTTLASQAERIADGELALSARPVSERDLLGSAFARMTSYLRELSVSAAQIAGGDLSITVTPRSERDALGAAFAAMVSNLRALLLQLQGGIDVLANASQEILSMTAQVATSAQETSVSISEISTTVEEVKQTAGQASERARTMTAAAQQAAQVGQQGKQAVEVTLERMQQIREQMQDVADSIVQLSERSQAIGEVVTTVNGLAEQSNLLGVNASIEAAKAGEVGRGFSVVAQEVKLLAEQSKQATSQARALLGEIQKAINMAVMTAEQSSKAVDKGHQQASLSGVAIHQLLESLQGSSAASLQIAASSQQQVQGMDQVVMAMTNIRKASEENAAGTRQAEQAALNLHELGRKLMSQMASFKV